MKTETKIIWVEVKLTLPIEIPVYEEYNENFDIEDNHCPATGIVGSMIEESIKVFDNHSFCWACAMQGKNRIVNKPKGSKETIKVFRDLKLLN